MNGAKGKDVRRLETQLETLKRAARAYMHAVEFVPMRAVYCNQKKEELMWKKLVKLTGFRPNSGYKYD
jgi:hypothetical protein